MSDTQRLVRKHLSDPNHVFTDEEIANVRVGMSPPLDAETRENLKEIEEIRADRDETGLTPWDTVEGEQR